MIKYINQKLNNRIEIVNFLMGIKFYSLLYELSNDKILSIFAPLLINYIIL